jgi:hypothetical protein
VLEVLPSLSSLGSSASDPARWMGKAFGAAPRDPALEADERRRSAAAIAILVLASYLFRLPALLNARSTNSDAAVVGLQAMHLLRGEHSAFLWGSGYQTSADAYVSAAFFALAGATPIVLMLSSLTLHVVATGLVFSTLKRRFGAWTSLLLAAPLVVSPSSIHTYALYPPRQLAITLAVAGFWAIHGASRTAGQRAQGWLAAGGLFYALAVSADPYPLVLAPTAFGYAFLVSLERPGRRLMPFAAGLLVGLVPFLLLRQSAAAKSGPMTLSLAVVHHNWDLLVRECLPWALSYKVYYAHHVMDYLPWEPPMAVRVVQIAGACSVGFIVVLSLLLVGRESLPRSTRHLGFVGAATFPIVIGAFLVSVMVMDHFSMRYLAALTLMLPFACAPVAHLIGTPRFALLLAPHLVASALGGWVGYGPFVRGASPVTETPELKDDYTLYELLRSRGIRYAEADYWTSYRLTFLFGERLVLVPTNPAEDRYAPYRRAFEAAPVFAYVYDPGRSRENLDEAERMLQTSTANRAVEKTHAGGLTVFVVTRR